MLFCCSSRVCNMSACRIGFFKLNCLNLISAKVDAYCRAEWKWLHILKFKDLNRLCIGNFDISLKGIFFQVHAHCFWCLYNAYLSLIPWRNLMHFAITATLATVICSSFYGLPTRVFICLPVNVFNKIKYNQSNAFGTKCSIQRSDLFSRFVVMKQRTTRFIDHSALCWNVQSIKSNLSALVLNSRLRRLKHLTWVKIL